MQCSDTIQIIATFATLITISSCSVVNAGTNANSNGHIDSNPSSYYSDSVFRNFDTQLLRIGSRLDQLMMRLDHLDSRVGRVQSTGHLRFDSIETSMQTTRQRLDLWSNQLNLIEEQLTRKWKNMENRFDSLVSTLDSKLDTKFNLIQRDNRRHNEYISQAFSNVIISHEKLKDRVVHSFNEMNSTLLQTQSTVNASTSTTKSHSSTCLTRLDTFLQNLTTSSSPTPPDASPHHSPPSSQLHQTRRTTNMIQPTDQLAFPRPPLYSSYYSQPPQQNSTPTLISTKVSNMFDELVKRSHDLEAIVKDTYTMSNMTRREVQDGFMALIPIVSQVGMGNERSNTATGSGEIMSMVLEALSSVEQMSTSVVRRMGELNRSINERFEMVSMTLNGFLESCLRIQERTPQLEDGIVDILLRVLDSVDNSTRNATETWQKVKMLVASTTTTRSANATNCTNNLGKSSSPVNATLLTGIQDGNDTAFNALIRAYEEQQEREDEYDNEFGGLNAVNQENGHVYSQQQLPFDHGDGGGGGGGGEVVSRADGGDPTSSRRGNPVSNNEHSSALTGIFERLSRLTEDEEEHVPE